MDKNIESVPGKEIFVEQLEEMFKNIQETTDWNTSSNLLWGYFFTHHEPKRLHELKNVLISKNYVYVDIFLTEKEDLSEPDQFWLHVEKVEAHTPKSLDVRNNEFYILAHEFELDSYDGMDVGPAEGRQP